MRNARKDTRRRSVNAGLLAGLFALLIALVASRVRKQLQSSVGARSTWSVTPPPRPSTKKASSRPSRRPRRARASASPTPSAPPVIRAARSRPASPPRSSTSHQAGDMTRLVEAGTRLKGTGTSSPTTASPTTRWSCSPVRKGNPIGIHSFNDLLSKNVSIVTPNPFSSGSARWNIMAVYGSQIEEGKSPAQALAAVKTVLEKTKAQPGSGRDAMTAFTQGQGDVLLSYENEAIAAEKAGENSRIRHPRMTRSRSKPRSRSPRRPPPQRRSSSNSSGRKLARRSGPNTATARSTRSWSTRSSSRPRRDCSRSPSSAAGARSRNSSSKKPPARSPRSRRNSGSRLAG